MPENRISGKGKTVHRLVPAIALVISVLIISGTTLIASIIYTSPDYPQFKKPLEIIGFSIVSAILVGLLIKAGFDIYAEFFKGRRLGIWAKLTKIIKFLHGYALPTVLGAFLLEILGICVGRSPIKLINPVITMALTSLRAIGRALIILLSEGWNLIGICIALFLVGLFFFLIGKIPIHYLIRSKGRPVGSTRSTFLQSPKSDSHSAFDLLPSEQATKLIDLNYRLHGPLLQPGIKCEYPNHARGSSKCWLKLKWDFNSGGKWIYAEEEIMNREDSKEYAHGKTQE